ncbi:hypothetical protein JCM17845_05840 [Iodidimonas gelatinilytica]|uniref:Uncharacterized protein n=1 Tax=Iodidimonas gelatinilytica TaxID=1236966 RepID=A0A5A7MVD4_9PROT|nr:hypothetical protein JCM17845_05840 [Iodidimonas gelatinilytica]
MKSGIMEVPDMFVVTKADLGDMAAKAVADLEGALSLRLHPGDWDARVLQVSTLDPRLGIGPLIAALDAHEHWLKTQGLRDLKRRDQMKSWGRTNLLLHIGRDGLAALSEKSLRHLDSETPFQSFINCGLRCSFKAVKRLLPQIRGWPYG